MGTNLGAYGKQHHRHRFYHYLYKQAHREEQRRYEDSHLRLKIEMLEAKRALLRELVKGFSNGGERGN